LPSSPLTILARDCTVLRRNTFVRRLSMALGGHGVLRRNVHLFWRNLLRRDA
jgi:hypothetical protein